MPQPEEAPPHRARKPGRTTGAKPESRKQRRDPQSRTLGLYGNLSPPPQSPYPPLDAAIFRMTPAARRRSCAPPAHTPSQSASQTHLAPPPPRRASGRRLQVPEGPSRTPPRVFSARQWVEAPREPVPAPPARLSQSKGWCVCEGKWGGGLSSGQGGPARRSRGPGGSRSAWSAGSGRVVPPPPPPRACAPRPLPPCHPPRLPRGGGGSSPPPPSPGSGGPRDAGPHRVSPAGRCLGRLRGLAHPAAAHQHPAARRGHQPALQRLQVPRPPEEQGELVRRRGGAAGERRAGPGRGPRASSRRSRAVPAPGSSSPQPRTRPSPPGLLHQALHPPGPAQLVSHTLQAPTLTCPSHRSLS